MDDYRKIEEITALLEMTIDSCLDLTMQNLSDDEKQIINRLNEWRDNFQIDNQIMQIFEAPISDIEFKDILRQVLKPILDDIFFKANEDGIITEREQAILDNVTKNFNI